MSETEGGSSPAGIVEEEMGPDEQLEVVDEVVEEMSLDEGPNPDAGLVVPTDSSEEEEYEVEKIVSFRYVKKKKQYLVKWVNYSDEWNTWEPLENLDGSHELVKAFEAQEAEKDRKKDEARAVLEEEKKEKEKSKSIIDDSSSDEDESKKPTIKDESDDASAVREERLRKDEPKIKKEFKKKKEKDRALSE